MRIFSKLSLTLILTFLVSSNSFSQYAHVKKAMVACESPHATKVGVGILKQGGNAVDAAVAVGFAMAVTYPEAGNIGGGGFMVIHFNDGTNTSIDYREKAPLSAHRDMFLDEKGEFDMKKSTSGWSASGVPGSVAGMIYAQQKYGKLDLKDVIQPAIDLAKRGFEIDFETADRFNAYGKIFMQYVSTKKIFTKPDTTFSPGDLFVQSDLASTLTLIRDKGWEGFYKGRTAELIAEQSQANGGYISLEDLANYKATEREPVKGTYHDLEIVSMGPTASGGIALIQALNILENFEIKNDEWGSSIYIHLLVETFKYVFADRSEHLGDMEFYDVPIEWLISKRYAHDIASKILNDYAVPSEAIAPGKPTVHESNQTTHYSVIDENGNAVSVTTTINGLFGNKIVVDGAGFFMNNEMDDFSSKPGEPNMFGLLGGEANAIKPGKRMLSSMTPTIILRNDKPYLIVGARGGSRIITAVIQTVLNVVEFEMNIKDAMDAPRIHHQWYPDQINYEDRALSLDVIQNLKTMGHTIGRNQGVGKVVGILVEEDGTITGSVDSSGGGLAEGY